MIRYLILVGVSLILYGRTVFYYYSIDDDTPLNSTIKPKNKIHLFWLHVRSRLYTSPKLAHFASVLIHTINALLICYGFGNDDIGFLTALLFLVHPITTTGSCWLAGRPYAYTTMWILAMWAFKSVAPVFYYFSFSAFTGMFAPLLFIGTKYWFWALIVPVGIIVRRKWFVDLLGAKIDLSGANEYRYLAWRKWILVFKTIGYYFAVSILPIRLGIYHEYLYSFGTSPADNRKSYELDGFFVFGVFLVYVFATNAIWNRTPALFGLAWYLLFIFQWANFITLQQVIAERYVYLPLVGICYFMVQMLYSIPDPFIRISATLILLTAYSVRTMTHVHTYQDIYTAAYSNLLNFPGLYVVYTWLGGIEERAGHKFLALEWWFKGWKFKKDNVRLNSNIANMLIEINMFDDAEEFLKLAEENVLPENKKSSEAFFATVRGVLEKARKAHSARIGDIRFHKPPFYVNAKGRKKKKR